MTTTERPDAQLSIGELARCAGITSRAIRHYHATGLLAEPRRDASGYRRYGPGDLVRLVDICRLRALGLPTDQIDKALAETPDAGTDLPAALLALAVDVDAEIDRLKGVHDRLITLAESDDLDDAAELLSAGLRARGLLDPDNLPAHERARGDESEQIPADPVAGHSPGEPTGTDPLNRLLQKFRIVTENEAEQLAQELASILPTPSSRAQLVDLPMMDRLLGERLNQAQRGCMARLRTLLQARAPVVSARATVQL